MFKAISHHAKNLRGRLGMSRESFGMILLVLAAFIGPLFFIPVAGMSVVASKGYFFAFIGILFLLMFAITSLKDGSVSLPGHWLFRVLGIAIVVEFVGALLSPAIRMSLVGYGFESSTWLFLVVFCAFCLGAYRLVRSYDRAGAIIGGVMAGGIILMLWQVIRYIAGPTFLGFGVLGTSVSSAIGSWSDLGLMFGAIALVSVVTLELGGLRSGVKWIISAIGGLASLLLLFMNNQTVWIIVGFMALAVSLYVFTLAYWDSETKSYRKSHRAPWFGIALVIVSMLGIFFGSSLNSIASSHQSLVSADVRLSNSATARALVQSIVHNPATGYGPNMFSAAWNMAKPPSVSATQFAGASFGYGSGYLPTMLATHGVLGIAVWIAIIGMILSIVVRAAMSGYDSSIERYLSILLASVALYLAIATWFAIPGSFFIILLAIVLGSLLGLREMRAPAPAGEWSFIKDPRASFFGILVTTAAILAILFVGYVETRNVIGSVYAARGIQAESRGNLGVSIERFGLASAYAGADAYYRELSALVMSQISQVASAANSNKEAAAAQANAIFGNALGAASAAVSANRSDYQNWMALGNAYQTMAGYGVADAVSKAKDAYAQAAKRNPHDPVTKLALANLALATKDADGALGLIKDSIDYYPTSSAYILRAQIEASQNKPDDAAASLKAALALDPYNAQLAYQLGLLSYRNGNYGDAVSAFGRTVSVAPSFYPAYAYLGVSYDKAGDSAHANQVYDHLRQIYAKADDLISQVKNGSQVQAQQPVAPASATQPEGAIVKPAAAQKPVAQPAKKK